MKKLLLILLFVVSLQAVAQAPDDGIERPRLVVGIVVDQMKQEYLYRYYQHFGNEGFKRLMREGFMAKNAHYNYVPTVTGPGHASVYTGSTPAVHGIIGNSWYDKNLKKDVNCVEDPEEKIVGAEEGNGDVSPWRLLSSTITDELKLFTQKRAKVIGISVKDRGAVLPAGHLADAAYWYDSNTGRFITSTWYMDKLPSWVEAFNDRGLPDRYLSQSWTPVLPIDQYTGSGPDNSPYEAKLQGKESPTFPYNLAEMRKAGGYGLLTTVPFGNDYVTEMAKAALDGEQLGTDEWTDFLAVSFSTTDILGHAVGPRAIEVEDMYIRLDRNIADLLKTLDSQVGDGNYTVFLTADHAVADVAQYLKDNKMQAGYFRTSYVRANLEAFLKDYFPDKDIIEAFSGGQVFLNQAAFRSEPRSSGIEMLVATELIVNYLMAQEGVAHVYSESILRQSHYDEGGIKGMAVRGYHARRSGDIVAVLEPGWYSSGSIQGTTHGSPYKYDTHIPMLFYGHGVKKGTSVQYHPVTDIAPTLSVLLSIPFPSGATGQPIGELIGE